MIFQSRLTNIESSGIILSRIWREHRCPWHLEVKTHGFPLISCEFSEWSQVSCKTRDQSIGNGLVGLCGAELLGSLGGLRKMWRWVLTHHRGYFYGVWKIGYPMVPPNPRPSENVRHPSCGQNTRILPNKTWVTHKKSGSKTDTSTKNDAVAISDLAVENQASSSLECWTCECCTLECPKVWPKLRWPSLYKLTLAHPSLCNNKSRFILECRDFGLLHDMLYYIVS